MTVTVIKKKNPNKPEQMKGELKLQGMFNVEGT